MSFYVSQDYPLENKTSIFINYSKILLCLLPELYILFPDHALFSKDSISRRWRRQEFQIVLNSNQRI